MYTKLFKKAVSSTLTIMLITVFVFTLIPIQEVKAAKGLDIYTTYPSVSVKAGKDIETSIQVKNNTSEPYTVELEIVSIPDGWEGFFEGGTQIIHKVHADTKYNETVNLNLKMPDDVADGVYEVTVRATSGSLSDTLTLEYHVESEMENLGEMSVNYAELKGPSDASFTFPVTIDNNKKEELTYSLGADVERGWQVKFVPKYEDKQIASITVEEDKSKDLEIEISPPPRAKAGEYVIPIIAESNLETLTAELKIIITGNYDMNLTTPTGRLNVETTAGKEKAVDLTIENTGSSDLQNVKLSSWQPDGWNVEFDQKEIDVVPAGESVDVKAYINPDSKAIAGDYVVEFSADTPEATSSSEFRVTVKTSTVWGIVGVIIIILLVIGLYWTFNTYGRR